MLRSDGPNDLTSDAYARDFAEVKRLGSLDSTKRTADQTAAAIFWQDNGAAIWYRVFRSLATSHDLDTVDSARLFAMGGLAAADGAIGCWNDKAYWSFWRPITAIREAASDGNLATVADPNWVPLFDPSVAVSGAPLRDARVPRPPVGARLRERCDRRRDEELLRHGPGRVHGDQQQVSTGSVSTEGLRPVLGRDSRRSSGPASGAGSTSGPRTCRGRCSARRSRTTR